MIRFIGSLRFSTARSAALLILMLVASLSSTGLASDGWAQRQVVVKLVPGARVEAINQQYGTIELRWIPTRRLHLLEAPQGVSEVELMDHLRRDRRIEWAELNLDQSSPEAGTQSFIVASTRFDYEVQPLWTHLEVGQTQNFATGRGVVVAVLDTGVDTDHPELTDRIVAGGFNFVDNNGNVLDLANGIDDNRNGAVDEMAGHGTYIAGIIAAIAPEAVILPMKVLDDEGDGHAFQVAQGIYRALDFRASVINLSLSASSGSRIIAEAIEEANRIGVVVVAAAGNDGQPMVEFPAFLPSVIGVGSVDYAERKSDFSNYGVELSICAPGEHVVSLAPGDGFGRSDGTSAAAAITSAGAALVRSIDRISSAEMIHRRLRFTAVPIDRLNLPEYAGGLGSGRISLLRAVRMAAPIHLLDR